MVTTRRLQGARIVLERFNMSEHMSAAEYRKLMAKESKSDGSMSDEEFHKTLRNQQLEVAGRVNTKPRNHEEDDITIQVAEYCELLLLQKKITAFSHIPQETFTKSWVTKNKNKAMGVRSGVPDMLIVFPDAVLFLELKRLKGGVVSEAQKAWLTALNGVADANGGVVFSGVARGFDEAKTAIDNLLL